MTHNVEPAADEVFICKSCKTIYRSRAKNPKCPKKNIRCLGAIQRATARYVG